MQQIKQDKFIGKWVFPKSDDLEQQIGRDKSADINLIAQDIITKLKVIQSDVILDVCCGNGMLTCIIAKKCDRLYGVDFSEMLIDTAKAKNSSENIIYHIGNALEIDNIYSENTFDKSYIYFSFQYFNINTGEQLIKILSQLTKPDGLIFIGDIPDKRKIRIYYNTFRKYLRYIKNKYLRKLKHIDGEDSLGWWWHPKNIKKICKGLGLNCIIYNQDSKMIHSHYRFDVLIVNTKK